MTQLYSLDFADSNLTQLPSWIGKLKRLRFLYISNNQITSLPESLKQLNLREFIMCNNVLSDAKKRRIREELLPNT